MENNEKKVEINANELDKLKKLAYNGLPDDCVFGCGEVKFCERRQGEGNDCKLCSDWNN